MQTKFNHAANDSPRSGSSKRVTPVAWFIIIAIVIAIVIWIAVTP
jgi:hypothetical protein